MFTSSRLNIKKKVFDDTGCCGVWRNQDFPNSEWLISSIKLSLNDQFKQDWYFLVEHSSKTLNYRLYKENYLRILQDKDIYTLCKLRTTPITNYLWNLDCRWNNIDGANRICTKCDNITIGGEYHYIMECQHFPNFGYRFNITN